jgi:hypothetical protein
MFREIGRSITRGNVRNTGAELVLPLETLTRAGTCSKRSAKRSWRLRRRSRRCLSKHSTFLPDPLQLPS